MKALSFMIKTVLACAATNVYALAVMYTHGATVVLLTVLAALFIIVLSIYPCTSKEKGRLGRLHRGNHLMKIFLFAVTAGIAFNVFIGIKGGTWQDISLNCLFAFLGLALMFIISAVRLYTSSVQLGIKWRVLGVLFAFFPVVNIIILLRMVRLADSEYRVECRLAELDRSRAAERICATKYPVLMVHGVFFRDLRLFNYWGRIPEELEKNGAKIFYGSQQSADSVEGCAGELKAKIDEIVAKEHCEKVNIIAHSKGGLDSRYAISLLGAGDKVASLTTVNTPHRGCQFADYLMSKAPDGLKEQLASKYNAALKKLGDTNPDFIAAVTDLTATSCAEFNRKCPDVPGVYYQSVGSRSVSASGGRFPLNLSYHLVKYFDGPNDGLVSVDAMKWGDSFRMIEPEGHRGVTHADVIDLNRENIKGFDVREFYVGLVSDLKNKGF